MRKIIATLALGLALTVGAAHPAAAAEQASAERACFGQLQRQLVQSSPEVPGLTVSEFAQSYQPFGSQVSQIAITCETPQL